MKSYIAINLKDYHDKSKKWQGGDIDSVKVQIIGASSLDKAKNFFKGSSGSFMIFPLNSTKNIAYNQ